MGDPMEANLPGRGRWVVFAVAALAYSWTLGLQFQIDDYYLIPRSGHLLAELGDLLTSRDDLVLGGAPRLNINEHPNFQPILWSVLALGAQVSGVPVSPVLLHGLCALLHALTALLVLAMLRRVLPAEGALVGGICFAAFPGAAQAVSWISAGSHVLTVLFGAAALTLLWDSAHRDRWKLSRAWCAGILLGLAFWSHTQALTWFILGAIVLLVFHQRRRFPIIRLLTMTLPLVAAWWVRARFMGTWSLDYNGQFRAGLSAVPRMLEGIPTMVGQTLLPWNRREEMQDLAALFQQLGPRLIWFVPWLLLLVMPLALGRAPLKRRLILVVLMGGVLLLPTLMGYSLYIDEPDNRGSRVAYNFLPVLAASVGLLWCLAKSIPSSILRRVAVGVFALVALLSIDSMVHVARTEWRAAEAIRTRHESLQSHHEVAKPGTALLVIDSASTMAGIPLIGPPRLRDAARPPMSPVPMNVTCLPWEQDLAESRLLPSSPISFRVLRHTSEGYVATGQDLPPLGNPPALESAAVPPEMASSGALRWAPTTSVPARRISKITLPLAPGAAGMVALYCRAEGVNRLMRIPVKENETAVTVLLDEDLEWLMSSRFVDVLAQSDRLIRSADGMPKLAFGSGFDLEVIQPRGGARISALPDLAMVLGDQPPDGELVFQFKLQPGAATYRADIQLDSNNLVLQADGTAHAPMSSGTVLHATLGSPGSFQDLVEHLSQVLKPYGVETVPVTWRVLLLNRDDFATPRARSAWNRFELAL